MILNMIFSFIVGAWFGVFIMGVVSSNRSDKNMNHDECENEENHRLHRR